MKLIDPIDIKQSIKDGQLEAFAARGKVYIKDVKSGDCVKILEEQPSAEPNLQSTCNQLATDCISRKDAIDAIDGLPNCYNGYSDSYDKSYIIGVLEELPSAEPNLQPTCNQLATEIIRCKDCKHRFLQNGIWQCPFTIPASENHFCGYAERRTDE